MCFALRIKASACISWKPAWFLEYSITLIKDIIFVNSLLFISYSNHAYIHTIASTWKVTKKTRCHIYNQDLSLSWFSCLKKARIKEFWEFQFSAVCTELPFEGFLRSTHVLLSWVNMIGACYEFLQWSKKKRDFLNLLLNTGEMRKKQTKQNCSPSVFTS